MTYAAVLSGPVNHRVVVRRVPSQSESVADEFLFVLSLICSPVLSIPPGVGPSLSVSVQNRTPILLQRASVTQLGKAGHASLGSPICAIPTYFGLFRATLASSAGSRRSFTCVNFIHTGTMKKLRRFYRFANFIFDVHSSIWLMESEFSKLYSDVL